MTTATERLSLAAYRALVTQGGVTAKPVKRVRRTEEEDLHRDCMAYVTLLSARHSILRYMFHVPNGGKRPTGEAGKLRAMGTKRGFPDLSLPRRRGAWRGLAVELKSSDGKVAEDQWDWLNVLREEGYLTAVCRTFDEFECVLTHFLGAHSAAP